MDCYSIAVCHQWRGAVGGVLLKVILPVGFSDLIRLGQTADDLRHQHFD